MPNSKGHPRVSIDALVNYFLNVYNDDKNPKATLRGITGEEMVATRLFESWRNLARADSNTWVALQMPCPGDKTLRDWLKQQAPGCGFRLSP